MTRSGRPSHETIIGDSFQSRPSLMPSGFVSEIRRGIESKGGKVALSGFIVLGVITLSACVDNTSAAQPSASHSETVKAKTIDQQVQEKIAERPKEGTPEYDAIFAPLVIHYVKGQPPEEVVQELHNSMLLWTEMGYSDAPQTSADITKWQMDTSRSVKDLTAELQLNYYDKGAADTIYGPGWEKTALGQYAEPNIAKIHASLISSVLLDQYPQKTVETVTNPGITSSSATDIIGESASTRVGADGEIKAGPNNETILGSSISYHLHAVDTNGDGKLDRWLVIDHG